MFNNRREEYKNISKKIEKEVYKHSTVANKEVEVYLNEQGIFDEDINELFTEEELKTLEYEDLVDWEIYVSYYAVEDNENISKSDRIS